MAAIAGSIQTGSYDGEDGKKRYTTEVVADEVYFTGEKAKSADKNGFEEIDDGGLPWEK